MQVVAKPSSELSQRTILPLIVGYDGQLHWQPSVKPGFLAESFVALVDAACLQLWCLVGKGQAQRLLASNYFATCLAWQDAVLRCRSEVLWDEKQVLTQPDYLPHAVSLQFRLFFWSSWNLKRAVLTKRRLFRAEGALA